MPNSDIPIRLSVLMPVYNCQAYLDEAILSIRNQTYIEFEFLIVNDGSTDNSLELIQRHAAEDDRIVVLDRPNGGIVHALNAGLERCQGKFIARMDGDDIALPERLAVQIRFLDENPDYVLVGTQIDIIDSQNNVIPTQDRPTQSAAIVRSCLEQGGGAICHPTFMLRAAAIRQIGGYQKSMQLAEDLDVILRLSEIGQVANVPERLLRYRIHTEQTSHSYNLDQTLACFAAVKEAGRRNNTDVRNFTSRMMAQASWQATDLGERMQGIQFAIRSVAISPLSPQPYRTLARALLFGLLNRSRKNSRSST